MIKFITGNIFDADAEMFLRPGGLFMWKCPKSGKIIVYLENPSEYAWIRTRLIELRTFIEKHENAKVAIRCEYGNLNRTIVQGMICAELKSINAEIDVYEYEMNMSNHVAKTSI